MKLVILVQMYSIISEIFYLRSWSQDQFNNAPGTPSPRNNATATLKVNGRTVTTTGTTVRNASSEQKVQKFLVMIYVFVKMAQ